MKKALKNRALLFFSELKKEGYPNSQWLARESSCSRSTAVRSIEMLRDEFGVPLQYDESKRGYFLTNPRFELELFPPGRNELFSAAVAAKCSGVFQCPIISDGLQSLREYLMSKSTPLANDVHQALRPLVVLSQELKPITPGVGELLLAAKSGATLEFTFTTHKKPVQGRIVEVRFSPPKTEFLLRLKNGETKSFNAKDVTTWRPLDE